MPTAGTTIAIGVSAVSYPLGDGDCWRIARRWNSKSKRSRKVRKGLLTNEEVLEEIKVVRREMEGKRGM